MDRLHYRSMVALLESGYDTLLEKPMGTMAWGCADLVARANKLLRRRLEVCHLMRYAPPFFRELQGLVVSGALGDIVSLAFAAEASRVERRVVDLAAFSTPAVAGPAPPDAATLGWME